jgi:hypothetical protein
MSASPCKGSHKGHLCVLVSEKRFDDIRKLAKAPKHICFNCGRVADSDRNLCNPMPMSPGPAARDSGT